MSQNTPPCGYSADTETLTRRGWVTFDQILDPDQVATRSPGGFFEWQVPTERLCVPFAGEMVEFRNKSINLLVTPGHRMLVRRKRQARQRDEGVRTQYHDWHIRAAEYFADHPGVLFEVPVTSFWNGPTPAEFVIPGRTADRRHPAHERAAAWLQGYLKAEWNHSGRLLADAKAAGLGEHAIIAARHLIGCPSRKTPWPDSHWETGLPTREATFSSGSYLPAREVRVPMSAFCQFLGLFISEGWTGHDGREVFVSQFPTSRHLPEIKRILDSTGMHWSYDEENFKFLIACKQLGIWLTQNVGHLARNKCVPVEFKNFGPKLLNDVLHGMLIGDGHDGPLGQRYYTTTSELLADDLQEVYQKLGVDSWIRPAEPTEGDFGKRSKFNVFERLQRVHGLPSAKRQAYTGNVYSAAVPNGTVYVRRNGRAVWCFSSAPDSDPGTAYGRPRHL
jgi:ribonucleoside-triphosphate reductase (formate)